MRLGSYYLILRAAPVEAGGGHPLADASLLNKLAVFFGYE